jgi:molecular chaperone GrpE
VESWRDGGLSMFRDPKNQRPEESEPRVRVTDKRRINLDENREQAEEFTDGPSLKPTYVEELEARTKAAEQKLVEVQNRFDELRKQLQRETDETRQRLNRAAEERAMRDKANFIASLLPVMDNLTRAIQAAETSGSLEILSAGVRGTAASFENALINAGVEPIDSVGQDFNPELHEAVDTIPVDSSEDGKIINEYSRGFRIGDRLLRPSRVQVGRGRQESKEAFQ